MPDDATDTCMPVDEMAEEAKAAARNKKVLSKLVTRLGADRKSERAETAKIVHEVACIEPVRLEPHADQLIAALGHPEAQTRWEVLGALEELAEVKPKLLERVVDPASDSLHDEDSSVVRLAAFRLLAVFGSSSIKRAERVWPLLDEALRCYHGDSEYPGMLTALATLVEGKAPAQVKKEAAELVEPDASHPKAAIGRGARRVFSIATQGRTPKKRVPGGMAAVEDRPKKGAKGAKGGAKKPPKKTQAPKTGSAKKVPAKKAPGKKK